LIPADTLTLDNLSPGLQDVLDRLGRLGGSLLPVEAVANMRRAKDRDAARNPASLRQSGTIFGVKIEDQWLYPSFQFNDDGQAHQSIGAVLELLPDALEGWTLLDWFVTPQQVLGRAPAQLLGEVSEAERDSNVRKLVALAKHQLINPLA